MCRCAIQDVEPGKLLCMRGNGAGERKGTAPKETRVEEGDGEKKKATCQHHMLYVV